MKKIVLSMAAIATVSMAGGDIAPVEPVVVTESAAPTVENGFMDRFHFKGDLRLRYESIERDDKDNKYRNRYRLRLGAKTDINDRSSIPSWYEIWFRKPNFRKPNIQR
jgi:hypothetical protein